MQGVCLSCGCPWWDTPFPSLHLFVVVVFIGIVVIVLDFVVVVFVVLIFVVLVFIVIVFVAVVLMKLDFCSTVQNSDLTNLTQNT